MNEYINLLAEVAALRQRAEAAERERDAWLSSVKELEKRAEMAEFDLSAERALKHIAFKRLDEVRTVVEQEIIPALEAAQKYIPGSEVRNWPPGFRLRDDAMRRLPDALAAARKTLEDEQREGVMT